MLVILVLILIISMLTSILTKYFVISKLINVIAIP